MLCSSRGVGSERRRALTRSMATLTNTRQRISPTRKAAAMTGKAKAFIHTPALAQAECGAIRRATIVAASVASKTTAASKTGSNVRRVCLLAARIRDESRAATTTNTSAVSTSRSGRTTPLIYAGS